MTCYDKHISNIVYLHTGEKVYNVPDGGLSDVLMMLPNPLAGLHRIMACIVFIGVWI